MSLKEVKSVQIDDQKGILYSAGNRSLLIPIPVVNAIDTTFAKSVGREGADILMCKIGEALGRGYVQSLQAVLNKEGMDVSVESCIEMSCNAIFLEAGWGSVKICNLDVEESLLDVEILYSPSGELLESESYSLEKGILTGVVYELVKKEVYCELVSVDKEKHSVRLKTSKNISEEIQEKEKIVLISRRELEEASQKLKTVQKQLVQSEKLATIGLLTGGVAHEINTPLSTILTNTEMLMAEIEDEDQKESLEFIERSTQRCKIIVEQLLNYSRTSPDDFYAVDMREITRETCNLLRHDLRINGVQVETLCGEVDKIKGNPNELQQVITSLIVNAIDSIKEKFIDIDGMKGKIEIKCYQEDDKVIVIFADNGKGIKKEDVNVVFDPFFTTKDVGKGTGLGLSVVQGIIEKHAGGISVSSSYGEGCVFTITLPVA